jgi:hypothetical protein
VDLIVSSSFLLAFGLIGTISFKAATSATGLLATNMYDWQIITWLAKFSIHPCKFVKPVSHLRFRAFLLSVFLLRFMTLGSRINRKYQNTSVLLTEQVLINPLLGFTVFLLALFSRLMSFYGWSKPLTKRMNWPFVITS